MNFSKTVILLTAVACSACTTMQEIPVGAAGPVEELEPGDSITVHEKSGRVWNIQFEAIENDELRGMPDAASTPVAIPLADIHRIEAERVDGLRTSLLVVGTAASVVVLVAAIEAAAAGAILNAGY